MSKRFRVDEACIIEDNILIVHKTNIPIQDVLKYAEKKGVAGLDFRNRILFVNDIEEICNGLRDNPQIIFLSLSKCRIDDWGVNKLCAALQQNIGLSELCLDQNQITSSGAAALGFSLIFNTNLYLLDLDRNLIEDEGVLSFLSSIKKNNALGSVHFTDNPLTKTGRAAVRHIDDITKGDVEHQGYSSEEEDIAPPQLDLYGEDYDY